jgi:hypothetical protein
MKLVLNCAQCKLHSENVIKITNFKDMGDIYVALRLKSLQQKLYGHHHVKKLYRGSYIDPSCQVWLHFVKHFQRRRFF